MNNITEPTTRLSRLCVEILNIVDMCEKQANVSLSPDMKVHEILNEHLIDLEMDLKDSQTFPILQSIIKVIGDN